MSSVLPSTEKCGRCVNFIPRNWSCLEWRIQVQPEAKPVIGFKFVMVWLTMTSSR